jgi:ribosomal RNA-processing protein 12
MRITEDGDSDQDADAAGGESPSMGAYLEAMRGEDGHTRDSKGKARFNKTQGKRGRGDVDEEDVAVTEGLKELDVGGGRRKKVKRETVRVGAEFKAKVRTPFLLRSLRCPRWS